MTRPLVEAGGSYTKQIGLSGRTVRPFDNHLGISGAVQFTACMNTSQCIIAITKIRMSNIQNCTQELWAISRNNTTLCSKIRTYKFPGEPFQQPLAKDPAGHYTVEQGCHSNLHQLSKLSKILENRKKEGFIHAYSSSEIHNDKNTTLLMSTRNTSTNQ